MLCGYDYFPHHKLNIEHMIILNIRTLIIMWYVIYDTNFIIFTQNNFDFLAIQSLNIF